MKCLLNIIATAGFVLIIFTAHCQQTSPINRSFSIAALAGDYGYDTGIGLEVGTPTLMKHWGFRLKGTKNWLEAYNAQFNTWAKYEILTVSMMYYPMMLQRARTYLESGPMIIFGDKKFTDQKLVYGFSSSLGVELFVFSDERTTICYYFSGGYAVVDAYAEKLETKPRYGQGFIFNNGFRLFLLRR